MRIVLVAPLVLLAACAPADGETVPGAAAIRGAAPQERAALSVARGDTTLVTDRFTRTPQRLESELSAGSGKQRLLTTAALNPDATVSRLDLRLVSAGGATGTRGSVVFQGDSAFFESVDGTERQSLRVGGARGAIPLPVSEAVSMVEQILRRARVMGGAEARVPVLSLDGGVHAGTATVTFRGADSARIVVSGRGAPTEILAATDARGRLLGARVPASRLVVRRTR